MHWCREVKQFASATISQKRRFAESFWFAVFSVVIARSSIESERYRAQELLQEILDSGISLSL